MIINTITISNFLSFADGVVVSLDELASPILIVGKTGEDGNSNGAGKSSLLESVYWALTGKTVRGVRAADVIRIGEKKCSVKVKMTVRGVVLVVLREYSESKKRVVIEIDGKEEAFHDSRQGTERVLEFLGMTEETLSYACFYGRSFNAFSRMEPQARSDLIDMLAQGSRWEKARARAYAKQKELDTQAEVANGNKRSIAEDLENLDTKLENTRLALSKKKEVIQVELAGLETEIAAHKQTVSTREGEVLTLSEKIEAIPQADVSEDKQLISDIENSVSDIERANKSKLSDVRDIELSVRANTSQIGQFNKDKAQFEKEVATGACSRCGQDLPTDDSPEMRAGKIADLSDMVDGKLKENEKSEADKEVLEEAIAENYKSVESKRKQVSEMRHNIESANEELRLLERSASKAREHVSEAKRNLANYENQFERLSNSTEIVQLKERIDGTLEAIESKRGQLTEIDAERVLINQKLEMAKFWVVGFKDIRFSVFQQTVSAFETVLNSFCAHQGLEFDRIEVSTWKTLTGGKATPKIDIHVIRGEDKLALEAMSEGETQRINIACFLAISSLIQKHLGYALNLRVFDEPMAGVDYDGKQRIFAILNDLSNEGIQVLSVDHDAHNQVRFASVLTVLKENGQSKV